MTFPDTAQTPARSSADALPLPSPKTHTDAGAVLTSNATWKW